MRLVFKDFSIPLKNQEPVESEAQETPADGQAMCPWNLERQKQRIIDKILEYLREKYNVMEVNMWS